MSCQGQATGTSFMRLGPVKRLFHSLIVLCSPNPHPIHTPHLWSLYFEEPHQLVILPEGVWRATGWSKHPWPVSELSFARSRNSLTLCKICRHQFPQPKPTWPRRGRKLLQHTLAYFQYNVQANRNGIVPHPELRWIRSVCGKEVQASKSLYTSLNPLDPSQPAFSSIILFTFNRLIA